MRLGGVVELVVREVLELARRRSSRCRDRRGRPACPGATRSSSMIALAALSALAPRSAVAAHATAAFVDVAEHELAELGQHEVADRRRSRQARHWSPSSSTVSRMRCRPSIVVARNVSASAGEHQQVEAAVGDRVPVEDAADRVAPLEGGDDVQQRDRDEAHRGGDREAVAVLAPRDDEQRADRRSAGRRSRAGRRAAGAITGSSGGRGRALHQPRRRRRRSRGRRRAARRWRS